MNQIISLIMIVLAVSCTAIFIDMVKPMLGFKEKNLIYVDGFLDKTELSKNVFIGHPFSGKWHKHWMQISPERCDDFALGGVSLSVPAVWSFRMNGAFRLWV